LTDNSSIIGFGTVEDVCTIADSEKRNDKYFSFLSKVLLDGWPQSFSKIWDKALKQTLIEILCIGNLYAQYFLPEDVLLILLRYMFS